jgi:DNA-binding XRE family transcriptional regulator
MASLRRLNRLGAAAVSHADGTSGLSALPSLVYWRVQRGFTQERLAERLGMHRNTLWGIEAGHPAFMRIGRRLANALSVQVADLIGQPPES